MFHEPAPTEQKEDKAAPYKAKLGIWMFLIYAAFYGVFVAINTIKPTLMEKNIGGLNLAIVYGFGLIIFALVQALIYNYLCAKEEERLNK
ncbi:MAG: DUF485 domain-containing protein [bacterium]|nr:DUF485 domain-containing protein [bacterium]